MRITAIACGAALSMLCEQAAAQLLSAVLPQSRSVQVGQTATAFGVLLNTTGNALTNCGIALNTAVPVTFSFFQTSPANAVSGARNARATIAANGSQNFLLEFVPQAVIQPTELSFAFTCNGAPAAPVSVGVNTFLFSASTTPVPDILSIGAVLSNDGITNVPGVNVANAIGVMSVAAINLGADQQMTAEVALSNGSIPASPTICETNPSTGACLSAPTGSSISTRVARTGSGNTSAYSVFVTARSAINFDPANVRVIVRFRDPSGAIRGATSTALRTRDIVSADSNQDGIWDDVAANSRTVLNNAAPSRPDAPNFLVPLIANAQNGLLLADLTDQSVANANSSLITMACIYFRVGNPNLASQIVSALELSLINNQDRLQSSLALSNRSAGVGLRVPTVDANTCQ